MTSSQTEVSLRGKRVSVPSFYVSDRTIVVTGRWIRMATVHQEDWMEHEPVERPEQFIGALKEQRPRADIFSFARRLPETNRLYAYHAERDNLAAIPITTYAEWWEKRLSRKTRQEFTRSQRLGVTVKTLAWDDRLLADIVGLFGRIPTKQGQPFSHYRKDADTVRREVSPYADRSQFIGAFCGEEFIGYLKVVFMGGLASVLNIICDETHFEKRPANALIARAVEACSEKGVQYLVYGKFTYGNKTNDSLAEFKRRNGFEKIEFPRYYIPLSLWGRVAIALRLHRGLLGLLPGPVILFLVQLRSALYRRMSRVAVKGGETPASRSRDAATRD